MISIIIPLYNKADCIARTIESVLAQSYRDFEVIVVDDGSTDGSKDIVMEICDSRIRYVYKENGGVSSARNYGARIAKYNWLFFLDADDVLLPEALSSLSTNCKEGIFIISGGFVIENAGVHTIRKPRVKGLIKDPLRQWWLKNIMPRTGSLLLTKQVFFSLGGFDERMSYNEDYGFLLKMLAIYEIFILPNILMVYTDDNKTLSIRKTPIESEFGYYLQSYSLENIYLRYFIYTQYKFTIKRRLQMNDNKNANRIKKEMNRRYTFGHRCISLIMAKYSSLYNKIYNRICLVSFFG